jgi:hypothetical protein
MDTEAGEPEVRIRPLPEPFAKRKVSAPIRDRCDAPVRHLEDVDPVLVEEAAVEELHLERQFLVTPQRLFGGEPNGSVLVVVEILQCIRKLLVRSHERLGRKRARQLPHGGWAEGRCIGGLGVRSPRQ